MKTTERLSKCHLSNFFFQLWCRDFLLLARIILFALFKSCRHLLGFCKSSLTLFFSLICSGLRCCIFSLFFTFSNMLFPYFEAISINLTFFAKSIGFTGLDFILYSHLDFFPICFFFASILREWLCLHFFFLYKTTQILFLFFSNVVMFSYLQNKIHL